MKVVINACYGGFGLSTEAVIELVKRNAKCLRATPINSKDGKCWLKEKSKFVGAGKGGFLKFGNLCSDVILHKDTVYQMEYGDSVRTDPDLIEVVETMKERSYGMCAKLKIVDIPDGVNWHISEYDGFEHIAENHRTFY